MKLGKCVRVKRKRGDTRMTNRSYVGFAAIIYLFLVLGLAGCGADNAGIALHEQGVSADIEAEKIGQESLQNRKAQEVSVESENDLAGQGTQEDLQVSETGTVILTGTEIGELTGEEGAALYDFGPVSYDLSPLPAMENKLYAEWNGNIYFRQYSNEDIEKRGLNGNFGDMPDTGKELMCLTPDGELAQVGTDYGCGAMYIVGGRLYSQRYTWEKTEEYSIVHTVVYSCELDGSDVREYGASEILAVRNGKVICEMPKSEFICKVRGVDTGGLSLIDTQTGREEILVDAKTQYSFPNFLDATDEEIFYYAYVTTDQDEVYDTMLYSVDYEGNICELTTVTNKEYVDSREIDPELVESMERSGDYELQIPAQIPCFKILGDDIYFCVGAFGVRYFMGGPIYSMKIDGSGCKEITFSRDEYFYLYDDGVNRVLYCYPRDADYSENMIPIVLAGEAPQDIILDAFPVSYDEPGVHLLTDSVLFYPDVSGICYVLLTAEDSEELSVDVFADGDYKQEIKDIEYVDGRLFFTVTDLIVDDPDIIWSSGYLRGRTACYCKDMESGEIRLLYEY